MSDFPAFMKSPANKVPSERQNTSSVEGYYYTGNDKSQMAFWTALEDKVSKEHMHDFDEYVVCVEGEYTVTFNDKEYVLFSGDELFIPKYTFHGGNVKKGTRTIHAFGGKRI